MGRLWKWPLTVSFAVCVALGSSARPARAQAPPLTFTAQAGYRSPHAWLLLGEVDWLISDTLALRARGGPALLAGPVTGIALAGVVARLDVLTWVPALFVLAGIEGPKPQPVVQLGAELMRYVSMHSGVVGSASVELGQHGRVAALITLGGRYSL